MDESALAALNTENLQGLWKRSVAQISVIFLLSPDMFVTTPLGFYNRIDRFRPF